MTNPLSRLVTVAAIVLLAFALRMAALERRPLHFDEGNNVYFGRSTPAEVLRDSIATVDTDPPGHRFALGLWMAAAGPSPFAIRVFSVLCSLLAVAGTYRGARCFGLPHANAACAAFVLAVLAYAIDNSQQAKGYAMGAGCAALSWLFWQRLLRGRARARDGAAYFLATALALSTHFYTAALLPMQWLFWLLERRRAWRAVPRAFARAWRLLALQVAACAPTGIWAALVFESVVRGSTAASADSQHLPLPAVLTRIFGEFALSQFAPEPWLSAGAGLLLALCAAGAWRLWRADQRRALAFAAALLVPLAGSLALSQRITFFFPRFLLFALPAVGVLLAGLWPRERPVRLRVLAASALCLLGLPGQYIFYGAPIDGENDYRPLVTRLRALARPGDGALATYIWAQGIVESYAPELSGRIVWHIDNFGPANVGAGMPAVVAPHRRVWSLNFRRDPYDPAASSAHWLRANWAQAARIDTGSMRTLLFVPGAAPPGEATVDFNNGARLRASPLRAVARPGEAIEVTLAWSAPQPIDDDLSVFVQVLGPDGALLAQSDGDAVNGLAPAHSWSAEVLIDRRAILLPESAAPGVYRVVAGLYRRADGARIGIKGQGDALELGTFALQPP